MGLDMIFVSQGMGYAGCWDAGGVEIRVDHLRRRQGELHGEIYVTCAAAAVGQGRLHRAALNLSSTRSRESLAKALEVRSRVDLRWADYIEEFCTAVLGADDEGEPVVAVGGLDAAPPEGYTVAALLPEGKPTILYAPGGVGKSYLAVYAAVSVSTGRPMLGWPTTPGRVLYLDWETDQYEIDERVKRVARGMGVAAPEVFYRQCRQSLDHMAEQLAAFIAMEGVGLVIIDSVGMATSRVGEGGSFEETALRLFGAIRTLATTALLIDHVNSADARNPDGATKPYGSIYKVNMARSVWELRPGQFPGELGLYHRKVNRGALHAPVYYHWHHQGDEVRFTWQVQP